MYVLISQYNYDLMSILPYRIMKLFTFIINCNAMRIRCRYLYFSQIVRLKWIYLKIEKNESDNSYMYLKISSTLALLCKK